MLAIDNRHAQATAADGAQRHFARPAPTARASASSAITAPARRRCSNASSARMRPAPARSTFDGEPIAAGNVPATVRRGIAFVPQGHNVFPNLSVEQNLKISGLLVRPVFRQAGSTSCFRC